MREIIYSFIGSFTFGILFNIQRKNLIWAGISGSIGWGIYLIFMKLQLGVPLSTFMGAIGVGLYSEIMARKVKTPASVFSIIGIVPLVPGITAYFTVRYIVEGRLTEAFNKGIETVATAGGIAFGIMLITTIFQFASKWRENSR